MWSSWQQPLLGFFLLLLFGRTEISAYSLPDDWSIDYIQNSQEMPSVPPDNVPMINPVLAATTTTTTTTTATTTTDTDASSEFAIQPLAYHGEGDVLMSSDILSIAQGSNTGCSPSSDNTKRPLSRRIRAREEAKICPAPLNSGEEEKGDQLLLPYAGQQDRTGQNSDKYGETTRRLILPAKGSNLQYLFIPEESRPKRNRQLCPELLYAVPTCARPKDAFTAIFTLFHMALILDPCHPCTLKKNPFFFFRSFYFFVFFFFFSFIFWETLSERVRVEG